MLQFDPAAASAVETARRTRDKAKLAESRTREGDAENQRLQVELEVRDTAVVTCRLQLRLRRHTCSPCVLCVSVCGGGRVPPATRGVHQQQVEGVD